MLKGEQMDVELVRPVSLDRAANILLTRFPRHYHTRNELLGMIRARSIPFDVRARRGSARCHTYTVRVGEVVAALEGHAVVALKPLKP